MVYLFICEISIYLFAVSCSYGPFHTRQFASKLSVADVYESRHSKAAHHLREGHVRIESYQHIKNTPYLMVWWQAYYTQAGNNFKGVLTTLEPLRRTS